MIAIQSQQHLDEAATLGNSPRRTRVVQSLIHITASAILVLQLGEFYGPLGALLDLPTLRSFTTGLMIAAVLCLVLSPAKILLIFRFRLARLWAYLIWVGPLVILSLQFVNRIIEYDEYVYYAVFVSSFGILFAVSLFLAVHLRPYQLRVAFYIVLCGAVSGFLLNYVDLSFIRKVLFLRASEVALYTRIDRLVGFYPHPNVAAFSMLLTVVTIVTSLSRGHGHCLSKFFSISILVATLLLTGSRTSILLFILFISASILAAVKSSRFGAIRGRDISYVLIAFAVSSITLLIASPALPAIDEALMHGLERIYSFFVLYGTDGVADQSVYARLNVLPQYVEYSLNSPLLGFGLHATESLVSSGLFGNVSQNLWIQWAIEYGYIYVIFAAYVFGWTWLTAGSLVRRNAAVRDQARALQVLLLLLVVASLSINTMFMLRAAVICVGVSIGLVIRAKILASAASSSDRHSAAGSNAAFWMPDVNSSSAAK